MSAANESVNSTIADPRETADLEQLVQQLGDKQATWESRHRAARTLCRFKHRRAVAALLARVQDSSEYILVRCMAVAALRETRAPEAVPALRELIKNPATDLRLLQFSVAAVGVLGDHVSSPTLLALVEHPDPGVRRLAAFALGKLRDHQTVPTLLTLLAADRIAYVRREAALALGEISDSRAVGLLIEALAHPSAVVRDAAARALGHIPDKRSIAPLVTTLRDEEEIVAYAAVVALGQVGDAQALPALEWIRDHCLAAYADPDVFHRAAADAIARIQQR